MKNPAFRLVAHLDGDGYIEREYVGEGAVLKATDRRDVDRNGDSWGRTMTVKVKPIPGASDYAIRAALAASFTHGCRCAHDCCGHVQSYGVFRLIRRVKRQEYMVPVRFIRNV